MIDPTPYKLNLGCGRNPIDGFLNVDLSHGEGIDLGGINLDRNRPDTLYAELRDAIDNYHHAQQIHVDGTDWEVTEIVGIHFLEHIEHQLELMEALWRLAAHNATALFFTPFGSSDDAWEDPTHKRPMFIDSYQYFGQPTYHRADYGYRGDWLLTDVELVVWPDLARLPPQQLKVKVDRERNVVREMRAKLVKVFPIRPPEQVEVPVNLTFST